MLIYKIFTNHKLLLPLIKLKFSYGSLGHF